LDVAFARSRRSRFFKQGQSILAWGGPGRPVEAIQGEKWIPYNPGSNPTPAFPGYVSGHSTFSAASATVLQLMTGSDKFGYKETIPANFGRVEPGVPAVPTVISFKKFSDAADEAGMSRLYGGIHFKDDNTAGQVGRYCGRATGLRQSQSAVQRQLGRPSAFTSPASAMRLGRRLQNFTDFLQRLVPYLG